MAAQPPSFCACGCGTQIVLRPEHFHYGVPTYALGHNTRVVPTRQRAVPLVSQPCACGCGAMTTPGRLWRAGHSSKGRTLSASGRQKISEAMIGPRNHRFGKHPHNYNGGRYKANGYVLVTAPGHPFASTGGRVMEHRLVLEAHLRETDPDSPYLVEVDGTLYLRPEIEVHHIDGVKDHNVPDNLHPMSKAEHARHHTTMRYHQ